MSRIAVVNSVHSVSIRIISWMLREIGYTPYVAGNSFHGILPTWGMAGIPEGLSAGPRQFKELGPDDLVVDTHPGCETNLRARGWNGPILLIWQMPVGPDWVRQNFRPGRRVGSMGWSTSVGRAIREMGMCPNDAFWPPYHGPLDQSPRDSWVDGLVTVIENASGWSNIPVLEGLRDHPESKLELYGGGPPDWSRKIPQADLYARLRSALTLYHPKPFDTPGLAVMEAALQAVPITFCPDWLRTTEASDVFEPGVSCLVADTTVEDVLAQARLLRDPDTNRRIGLEGRRRMLIAADWPTNRPKFAKLIEDIRNW